MKRLVICCLVLVTMIAVAFAEANILVTADVPFAFHVGDAVLQAGPLQVSGLNGGSAIVVRATDPAKVPAKTRFAAAASVMNGLGEQEVDRPVTLVFNKYSEGRYFLTEVKLRNGSLRLGTSRAEREIITSTLVASVTPERVEIAANLSR